jgi:lipopolysaccharide/colanic/teichoic acid biosynthesis glycosyltransferase
MMDTWTMGWSVVGGIGAFGLALPYMIYPLSLRLFKPTPIEPALGAQPRVSVLIPAHDEAETIAGKIEDVLAQGWPAEQLEILIGDDGSTDDTARLASGWADRGVVVVRSAVCRGKLATLEALASLASGGVLVFTDAASRWTPGALRALIEATMAEGVGAAGLRYAVRQQDSGEGMYWRAGSALASRQAERDMLLGLHGACWAARRELWRPLPAGTVHDDFVGPMMIRRDGRRLAYVGEHVAWEPASGSAREQAARWVRIAWGNCQMCWQWRGMLGPHMGRLAWTLWATKVFKTLGLVWLTMLAAAAVALLGALLSPVQLGIVGVAAVAGVLAVVGAAPQLARVAGLGMIGMIASMAGVGYWLAGVRPAWGASRPVINARYQPSPLPTPVRIVKRGVDILAAVVGLTLFAPVMAIVALAIRLSSPGAVIFRQERVQHAGPGGERTFTMLKFRTMREDAEAASGPVWAAEVDPRVTRVGKIIRRARLDELPQFWNVLMGDMSLVGPRPERPHFTGQLQQLIPGYDDRITALKPGITGWAQIHCGYDTSVDSVRTKLLYDLAYAAHLYRLGSYLRIEVRVILETVVVALTGRGAH